MSGLVPFCSAGGTEDSKPRDLGLCPAGGTLPYGGVVRGKMTKERRKFQKYYIIPKIQADILKKTQIIMYYRLLFRFNNDIMLMYYT